MSKYLVTSALPYANGDIHIGHLVEYIQTDIFVRFLKLTGNEAIYICASDTHGTPIEINAAKKGMTPEEMVAKYNKEHHQDFKNFQIHFDRFYTTHSPETRKHAVNIFENLKKKEFVFTEEVEQYYCPHDKRFLPDRFVRGVCPKCEADDQYGDSCEKCGATYNPTDILNPACSICGNEPVRKTSKHYFVKLEKARPAIEDWINKKGNLEPNVKQWLKSNFLDQKLRNWDISRDKPYFGFKIPGEVDKFFYVWMDAPVGYIGTTQKYCDEQGLNFDSWWKPGTDSKVVHVIGKDITYFHTLFWPAMLHYGGYKEPSRVQIHGFLTVNGEKMSKSRGTSVKAATYLNHLDPQYLRFYYAGKLTASMDDIDLNLEDFRFRVNSDLVNKIVNLVSRTTGLLSKRLDSEVGEPSDSIQPVVKQAQTSVDAIETAYRNFEFSKALKLIVKLADTTNKYLQDTAPFKIAKTKPDEARAVISGALGIVKGISILLGPVLPEMKSKIEKLLNAERVWDWQDLDYKLSPRKINKFTHLAQRVDEKKVEAMIQETKEEVAKTKQISPEVPKFKKMIEFKDFLKLDLRIGRVIAAEPVKRADKLLMLVVDLGLEKRQVIAGIKKNFKAEELIGKQVLVVANLKPRKMRFGTSEAMLLAAENTKGELGLLGPAVLENLEMELEPGSPVN